MPFNGTLELLGPEVGNDFYDFSYLISMYDIIITSVQVVGSLGRERSAMCFSRCARGRGRSLRESRRDSSRSASRSLLSRSSREPSLPRQRLPPMLISDSSSDTYDDRSLGLKAVFERDMPVRGQCVVVVDSYHLSNRHRIPPAEYRPPSLTSRLTSWKWHRPKSRSLSLNKFQFFLLGYLI